MFDWLAIVLALLAIGLRLADRPKAAAIAGYSSAACSWVGRRRARAQAAATGGPG
jgi:hypothetical protein